MSSPLVAPPVVKAKALFCPNCGGPVELRGYGHALTVVCPQCLTVLDASTPLLKVLGQIQEKQRCTPKIPLGTRGKFGGAPWEVIGFQTRTIYEENASWDEYLLFNPYKGFRYITEYQGHWNFVTPMEPLPARRTVSGRPAVSIGGRTFKHFSGAYAATTFVLGEFPWRVKVGEKVLCDDFVDPPTLLSSETTEDEVTWSRGEYTSGDDIWKAFALPGKPPSPEGIFENQPAPASHISGVWGVFALFLLLIGLAIFFATFSGNRVVFDHSYHFDTADKGDPAFVTPIFQLDGRTSSLELGITTSIQNDWVYFNFALINDDTGTATDFGREVSFYSGTDSDGAWSEGGQKADIYIPAVPAGHYYLRVEPEMDASSNLKRTASGAYANSVYYSLTLRRDVPNYSLFWLVVLLLVIPPIWKTVRSRGFEVKRWMQSDYPPIRSGGD